MPEFVLNIPPVRPGTLEAELLEYSLSAIDSAATRIQRAEVHGDAAAIEAAERAYVRTRERGCMAALVRMRRRQTLRPARSGPPRPRCGARRARPRARRRRRGDGRGGGDADPDGAKDPTVSPTADAPAGDGISEATAREEAWS